MTLLTTLSKPSRLTSALGKSMTQTFGDWSPGKSVLRLANEAGDNTLDLATRYVTINEARAYLAWGQQIDMPLAFKEFFYPGDTKFGGYDHNHLPTMILGDIAEMHTGWPISIRAVQLIGKLSGDYAKQDNSYLTKGDAGYLGTTGRVRVAANIVALLYDLKRVFRLPGWAGNVLDTAVQILALIRSHLDKIESDTLGMSDVPQVGHLPENRSLSPFQLAMFRSALRRWRDDPEIPQDIRDRCAGLMAWCWSMASHAVKRDADGKIVGLAYDVCWPDLQNTHKAPGNVPFVHNGVPQKAHDGMGVALHLAGIDAGFDKFLLAAKAKELRDDAATKAKFFQ